MHSPMTKTTVVNSLLLFGSIVIALVLVETVLRLLPASVTKINRNIVYVKDEYIAYKFKPHSNTKVTASCFNTNVSANAMGFRGDEWQEAGGIAILGDSFMEAIQVEDDETLGHLLTQRLGVPVYNTGLSSFGTVAELLTYRSYLKEQSPKMVVLAFFENDILDNHCAISQLKGGLVSKPCATLASSTMAINTNYYSTRGHIVLRSAIKKYCYSCNVFKTFMSRVRNSGDKNDGIGDKDQQLEDEAWQITEMALLELKSEIERDGARFMIMIIPDQKYFDATSGEPETSVRLITFARQNNIEILDLYPPMISYARDHNLTFPYFSHTCDGHWSPLGHAVAAHILSTYLLEHGLESR